MNINKYYSIDQRGQIASQKSKPCTQHAALQTLTGIKAVAQKNLSAAKDAAQDIHNNFNQKLGLCGRFVQWIKSIFGKGEYSYIRQVDKIYQEILNLQPSKKTSEEKQSLAQSAKNFAENAKRLRELVEGKAPEQPPAPKKTGGEERQQLTQVVGSFFNGFDFS